MKTFHKQKCRVLWDSLSVTTLEFEEFINGHSGGYVSGAVYGKDGHCYNFSSENLLSGDMKKVPIKGGNNNDLILHWSCKGRGVKES